MIIILKENLSENSVKPLINHLTSLGITCHYSQGTSTSIIGLVGDTSKIDIDSLL